MITITLVVKLELRAPKVLIIPHCKGKLQLGIGLDGLERICMHICSGGCGTCVSVCLWLCVCVF